MTLTSLSGMFDGSRTKVAAALVYLNKLSSLYLPQMSM